MKLLITGAFSWEECQIEILEMLGWEVIFIDREDGQIEFDPLEIDAVICNWFFIHQDIKRFKNLKYIQLLSAGMDRVPLSYITEHNITINNARGVYSIPIAEFVVGAILQIYKHFQTFFENQKLNIWKKDKDLSELSGKRVLIVGTGSVGNEIAKRFYAFTNHVYGIDAYPKNLNFYGEVYGVQRLDEELSKSDIVILTLPLTEETKYIFSKSKFEKMKKDSIIVNIGRGSLIKEEDLLEALDDKLSFAILDVFEQEPLSNDNALWNHPKVLVTPHNSYVSENNNYRMWEVILKNLNEYQKVE